MAGCGDAASGDTYAGAGNGGAIQSEELREIRTAFDYELDSHYQPSSELGGDFWSAKVIDQDRLMLYLVDFSGHGVASALNNIQLHTI